MRDVIGQRTLLERLGARAVRGEVAHAYGMFGARALGKRTVALRLAQTLNCAAAVAGGCGTCLACRKIERGTHPDVRLVTRATGNKDIAIEQIREMQADLALRPLEGARRVVIVDDASELNHVGQDALLKTLEEPPAATTILLVTHVPDRLLGTIRSRCQTLFFHPLADEEIEKIARGKHRLDGDRAKIATLLARGSIGALAALVETLDEVIAAARDLQERAATGELNKLIEALGKIKDTEEQRVRAKRDLGLVAQALREVLLARGGYKPALATPAFLQTMSKLDEDAILERIETLIDHARMIDLNANVGLTVEDALLRV